MDDDIHRHQCLVRQLLKYRAAWGVDAFRQWTQEPKGKKIMESAKDDFIDQWKKGNRGTWGDWR